MRPTNRRHLLAGIGFFSFLGFAANGFFYSLDIQKKAALSETGGEGSELTENQNRRAINFQGLSGLFRNGALSEKSPEDSAKETDTGPKLDEWVLVGSFMDREGKKAFLLSSNGEVLEVSDGDKFGDGNKVVRIGAKSITYLDLDQSEVLIKLYNSPRNGELNEGS